MTDFGWAIRALRAGEKVYRLGWSGPGQYVFLHRGHPQGLPIPELLSEATGLPMGTVIVFGPFFMIALADGTITSWVPSVTDCLADDWMVRPKEMM